MRHRFSFTAVLLALCTTLHAAPPLSLEQRVVEHTFGNGIKLLVLERHFSPTVAIRMMFRTGSVDEVDGKTGLAHMFEHMMFKGTQTFGTRDYAKEQPLLKKIDEIHRLLDNEKANGMNARQDLIAGWLTTLRDLEAQEAALVQENELWNLYEREGASGLNASTSPDFTQYRVDLPSNKIELWAMLDSDRIRNPVFRQFYQEREVVKEERRMRVDTNPDGKLFEQFIATAYMSHPYRHPTIGWESDLDYLNVADLEDFYRRYYTPDKLTISIVGDVDAKKMIALVERYFGSWKAPGVVRAPVTKEPPQEGPRQTSVLFEAQPQLLMGFHIPTYPDPDQPTCYALAHILAEGTTSRLYKRLIEKDKIATAVDSNTDYPGERFPTLFILSAAPRHPHTPEEVVKGIESELERLKKTPVEPWELEKLRASVDVAILDTLQTNSGMASTLVYHQTIFGDWRYLPRFQERIKKMTAQELQAAARKYFRRENQTTAYLRQAVKAK